MINKISLVLIFILVISCERFNTDHGYNSIGIKNNSGQSVYVYGGYQFPDTSLSAVKPTLLRVAPGETQDLKASDVGGLIKFSSQKLTIFFLSKDTVDKYDWNNLRTDYNILERREILESDLVDESIKFPK